MCETSTMLAQLAKWSFLHVGVTLSKFDVLSTCSIDHHCSKCCHLPILYLKLRYFSFQYYNVHLIFVRTICKCFTIVRGS